MKKEKKGARINRRYSLPLIDFKANLIALLVILLLVQSAPSMSQVRIYVNTDLEGISGVFKFSQTREKDTPLNIQACEYFMDDLAAVIKGLRDGGATDIVVLDGHGTQAVLPHLMEPGATYITGHPRPGVANLTGLDDSFAGMVLLGFHAMMGTPDGVLCHTQSSRSENRYWYNDVESGEIAQSAAIAGCYGVPVIMVTGDAATIREAEEFLGEGPVMVTTKIGLSREAAILFPFSETRRALYEGAKKAVAAIPLCRVYKMKTPINVKMQYLNLDPQLPEPETVTVEAVVPDALHLFDIGKK